LCERPTTRAPVRIADYWIVNLAEQAVEVYRDPVPATDAP
jgi:hypothetical protein